MYDFPRFFDEPESSYFLFGPRGTGKSTLLQGRYKDSAIWIDLLRPEVHRQYITYPERLKNTIEGNPNKKIIVVDEIQKAPVLLSVVHQLMEEKKSLQFILTGSSSRKLKVTGADLLGGRALKCTLHPFMAAELGKAFNLQHALQFGLLPLIWDAKEPSEMLHAYINLYLKEEIQAEGLVRNLENFARFLEAISFSHATQLNITNVARECEVKRKTVENYINILEDLLLGFHINIFDKSAQRELSSHPKFYLFDAGVFNTLRPKGILDSRDEIHGAVLEGLIAHHLKAWSDYSKSKHSIYYWRTRAGVEVDFIVYGEKYFYAIEVKNAKRIHNTDIKSLSAFLQDYPMAKALLIYRGNEILKIENVLCIPCEDFLLQLKPDQPLFVE